MTSWHNSGSISEITRIIPQELIEDCFNRSEESEENSERVSNPMILVAYQRQWILFTAFSKKNGRSIILILTSK